MPICVDKGWSEKYEKSNPKKKSKTIDYDVDCFDTTGCRRYLAKHHAEERSEPIFAARRHLSRKLP
ncbi:hypothetical protein GCM10020370_68790 [Paenibacillus hodogayensis]